MRGPCLCFCVPLLYSFLGFFVVVFLACFNFLQNRAELSLDFAVCSSPMLLSSEKHDKMT